MELLMVAVIAYFAGHITGETVGDWIAKKIEQRKNK